MDLSTEACLYSKCTITKKNRTKDVSFFKLPTHSEELCKKWIINAGRYERFRHLLHNFHKEELSTYIICEKHFDEKDVLVNNRRKLLFRNAVPRPCEGLRYHPKPAQLPKVRTYSEISPNVDAPNPKPAPSQKSAPTSKPASTSKPAPDQTPQPIKQRKCCVSGCHSVSRPGGRYHISDNKIISFHQFPYPSVANFDLLHKWVDSLGIKRMDFIWNPDHYVCSEHFETDAFSIDREKKEIRLLPDAFPLSPNKPKNGASGVTTDPWYSNASLALSEDIRPVLSSSDVPQPAPSNDYYNNHIFCIRCRNGQKPMTTKEKKTVKYYYSQMKEYHTKYERQVRLYSRKISQEKARLQTLELELETLTKDVEAMRNLDF